ncbi:MAG: ATP-binding cassette domain-containing protein [Ferrovum sp.]|jgi:molybdate transport system ATP-binding protein|uniref:sulfate/molybdate ABC transporter ATP-binding protein n=1 Tax=Ferrovum sp. TaxID=2609467 RepID=UPI002633A41B|nr:ATP-binding cassette domain-containing protein [Ferrovum sp.]MBW8067489.1 ATP-binding cassette domain-containing protein [Ferrovum sp.]
MDVTVRLKKNLEGFALDVNWAAQEGIAVIFGPSGSGKSMTLQAIAGFVAVDEGYIQVGEQVFLDSSASIDLPPQRREIGYLLQNYALFPHMTVRQNILYGRRTSGQATGEFREMIALFQLEGLENRYPGALSGGQKQRVALARALMRKPGILLLDEPLAAVDIAVRKMIRTELKLLQRKLKIPMILITHDLGEALSLADKLIIYEQGRVVQEGDPIEIVKHPLNERVSELLGRIAFHTEPVFSF